MIRTDIASSKKPRSIASFPRAAGHTLAPTPPTGVCGKPLDAFLEALHGVSWHEVAVTKVRQLETPQAQSAGCSTYWKNENAIDSRAGVHASPGGPAFAEPVAVAHVCLYTMTATTDPDVGAFQRGFTLSAADSAQLAGALQAPSRSLGGLPPGPARVLSGEVPGGGERACWPVWRIC